MKILIFGCGVIGSVYASRFAEVGYDVSVYARGKRLEELKKNGLLYEKEKLIIKSSVKIKDNIKGVYDFVFVTVKYEQVDDALKEVCNVQCENIVTMVNNPFGYDEWEKILGAGRLIPAFPGAGGIISDGVLKADITPSMIQQTTYGEINGERTSRIIELGRIFLKSHIPAVQCVDMFAWQLYHLGLVVPLADAIYRNGGDNYSAGKNKSVMLKTALEIQRNINSLKKLGYKIQPQKIKYILYVPTKILAYILGKFYCSDFGSKFIYGHANKAKEEMMTLRKDYYRLIKNISKNANE